MQRVKTGRCSENFSVTLTAVWLIYMAIPQHPGSRISADS